MGKASTSYVRGAVTLAVLALLAGALVASPVGAVFTPTKTTIKKIAKKQVNKLALLEGHVLVQAQQNAASETPAGDRQINSLSITAPVDGFLIITGSAELDNDNTTMSDYVCLQARVDGANVVPGNFADSQGDTACTDLDDGDDPAGGDSQNLTYSVVQAVEAGSHTVTQALFRAGNVDAYEAHLVALFVPSGAVQTLPNQGL
jgi:hypothetical protein